jgi:ABC-type polysaccharide/polyol phosphate transport system ATPase subunit
MDRMNHYLNNGTTIVFVSHSASMVRKTCHTCLWLEHGLVKMMGTADEVATAYEQST